MEITPYSASRIFTFYHEANQLLKGEMCKPRMALVYPSRVCNHNCVYCSDAVGNKKVNRFMDNDLLLSLPEQLKDLGCESIETCGGGESLLHPKICEFIEKCVDCGLRVATLTNATEIRGKLLDLVANHFSYVRVSLDTFDEKIFNSVRRPRSKKASFDSVISNIKELIKRKGGQGKNPLVGLKACFTKETLPNMYDFVIKSREMGADSAMIKLARNVDPILSISEELEWEKRLIEIKEVWSGGKFSVFGSMKKIMLNFQCLFNPFHVFIDTQGELRLCCYWQCREKAHTYGNLNDKSLKDIWYSDDHWKAIFSTKPVECSIYDCKYIQYNQILKEALIEDKSQWQFV